MDLSIIVVNFNTKDLIKDCIESIYKEGSKIKKEVIVIDNGSRDGSVLVLKKLQKKYKNLILIFNKSNYGFSKANNQGIKKARGRYVLLLNSDTKVLPRSLGKLLEFAKTKKDAGVIGPRLLNPDGSLQPSCYHFPTLTGAFAEYFLGKKGFFEKYAPKTSLPEQVDAVVGAAFLITPLALKRIGLLDERYFFYFEDLDYCRKVYKKGLKVYYFPDSCIYHYHGASAKKQSKKAFQNFYLVQSSKIYHGRLNYFLITFILWLGQKLRKFLRENK